MAKTVMRYEILDRNGSDENVAGHPKPDGEWVRYEDIKHLLQDETPATPHAHDWRTVCIICQRALRDQVTGEPKQCVCWSSDDDRTLAWSLA